MIPEKCVHCKTKLKAETKHILSGVGGYHKDTGKLYCPGCGSMFKDLEVRKHENTGPR